MSPCRQNTRQIPEFGDERQNFWQQAMVHVPRDQSWAWFNARACMRDGANMSATKQRDVRTLFRPLLTLSELKLLRQQRFYKQRSGSCYEIVLIKFEDDTAQAIAVNGLCHRILQSCGSNSQTPAPCMIFSLLLNGQQEQIVLW